MAEEDAPLMIREIHGRKQVGFRGLDFLDMNRERVEHIKDTYEDFFISLHDATEEEEGPVRSWSYGRILHEEVDIDESDDITHRELGNLSPIEELSGDYDVRRAMRLYEVFNKDDLRPSDPTVVFEEFARYAVSRNKQDEAVTALSNLRNNGYSLTNELVRLWAAALDSQEDTLEDKIEAALREKEPDNPKIAAETLVAMFGGDDQKVEAVADEL